MTTNDLTPTPDDARERLDRALDTAFESLCDRVAQGLGNDEFAVTVIVSYPADDDRMACALAASIEGYALLRALDDAIHAAMQSAREDDPAGLLRFQRFVVSRSAQAALVARAEALASQAPPPGGVH